MHPGDSLPNNDRQPLQGCLLCFFATTACSYYCVLFLLFRFNNQFYDNIYIGM